MGYRTPADAPVSSTWRGHRDRTPPSVEPGTDYATAFGTPLRAAESGTVSGVWNSTQGGTGRFVAINLDDGRRVRYLHLSRIDVRVGQRVARGQIIGLSGASGRGSEWGYGSHVHVTLLATTSAPLANSIDFELYAEGNNEPAGGGGTELDDMSVQDIYDARDGDGRNMLDLARQIRSDLTVIQKSLAEKVDGVPAKVWAFPVQAQDENGHPVFKDGKPVMFAARGYLASTSARVGDGGVELDEKEIAAALAPLLQAHIGALSDDDIARLAKAAADEQDRRERERLGQL